MTMMTTAAAQRLLSDGLAAEIANTYRALRSERKFNQHMQQRLDELYTLAESVL
jgi:hypothetical protein